MGSVEDVVEVGIGACASADFVECRKRKPRVPKVRSCKKIVHSVADLGKVGKPLDEQRRGLKTQIVNVML